MLPTFSARENYMKLNLLQLRIQVASVTEQTWQRYKRTLDMFLQWTEQFHYDSPDATAALHWCTYLATTKKLLPSTLNQKLSHLQFVTDLGILPEIRTPLTVKFIHGLTNVVAHTTTVPFLPPSLLLKIFNLPLTTMIQDAILFQSFTGLRGGQMVKITPAHLLNDQHHLVPPYKKCKTTTMLSLRHVHPKILHNFKRHATDDFCPILPYTAATYKAKFATTMKGLGSAMSSHSARHFFATIHNFLQVPLDCIGGNLIHKRPSQTTGTYIHALSPLEAKIVLHNPKLFIPLQSNQLVSSVTAHLKLLED